METRWARFCPGMGGSILRSASGCVLFVVLVGLGVTARSGDDSARTKRTEFWCQSGFRRQADRGRLEEGGDQARRTRRLMRSFCGALTSTC